MRKLKDDKKIRWTENYTEKTDYLRDMYEDIVGPHSYWRFEGEQIDGSGEWYVVISPAGVYGEHERKFFAGIRKLPDKWPAGGKKFDSLIDAFTYAHDTWGVPKPKSLPRYSGQDLVGIGRRIDEWKENHEAESEKEVEKEDRESSSDSELVKEAMGSGIHNKGGCSWHHSDFSEMDNIYRSNYDICEKIDLGYARLMRLAARSSNAVLTRGGTAIDIPPYRGEGCDFSHISQQQRDMAIRAERRIASIYHHAVSLVHGENISEPPPNEAKTPSDLIKMRRMKSSAEWNQKSRFLVGLQTLLRRPGNYWQFESEMFNNDDFRKLISGLVAYAERQENESQFRRLSATSAALSESFSCCFRRSAMEKTIHQSSVKRERECARYRVMYGFDEDLPESQIPINDFMEYCKTDGNMRLGRVAPYRSSRDWKKMISFSTDVLSGSNYSRILRIISTNPRSGVIDEEISSAIEGPLRDALVGQFDPVQDINKKLGRSSQSEFRTRFINTLTPILQQLSIDPNTVGVERAARKFTELCEGRLVSTMRNEDGSMGYVRVRNGHELSRLYTSIGRFYAGVVPVHSNVVGAAMFFESLQHAEDVALMNSTNNGRTYTAIAESLNQRYSEYPEIMNLMTSALESVTVTVIDRNTGESRISLARDARDTPITLHDFYKAFKASGGYNIYPGEIIDIFNNVEGRIRLIDRDAVEAMETAESRKRLNAFMNRTGTDHLTVPQACRVMQMKGAERVEVPSMSTDIARALDSISEESSVDFFGGVAMSFTFGTSRDRSGMESADLSLDLYGKWQYLRTTISSIWDISKISPEIYGRFMKLNMIPYNMPHIMRRTVIDNINNNNFNAAEEIINNYFINIRSDMTNQGLDGGIAGGYSSLTHQSYLDSAAVSARHGYNTFLVEPDAHKIGRPEGTIRIYVDGRLREYDGYDDFINNASTADVLNYVNRLDRRQEDGLNSISQNLSNEQQFLRQLKENVNSELGRAVVEGSVSVPENSRAEAIRKMTFMIPSSTHGITDIGETEGNIRRVLGNEVSGGDLVTADGHILSVEVLDNAGSVVGHISISDLEPAYAQKRDKNRAYAEVADPIFNFKTLSTKRNKGSMGLGGMKDYSNDFGDGHPHLEEAARSNKSYGQFMEEVLIGMYGIYSIPHTVNDTTGTVNYPFQISGDADITSRDLAERYTGLVANNAFGRGTRISEDLTRAIRGMHDFLDNSGMCLDNIIDEVARRVDSNDSNPIWWRDGGNVEFLQDDRSVNIARLLSFFNAYQYVSHGGSDNVTVPHHEMNTEAKRVMIAAEKIVKRDAFLAIIQGGYARVVEGLPEEDRELLNNVAQEVRNVANETTHVITGVDVNEDLSDDERIRRGRMMEAVDNRMDAQVDADIAGPVEDPDEDEAPNEFEQEADIARQEAIQTNDAAPGPDMVIIDEEDGVPDAVPPSEAPVDVEGIPTETPPVIQDSPVEPAPTRIERRRRGIRRAPSPPQGGDDNDEGPGGSTVPAQEAAPRSSSSIRGIMKESIIRMAQSSIRLAKKGKIDKALEIKRIINRYIEMK